ncbi:MAG TPA: carbonic anhydrase, partial [Acidimicrobiales bacterium]
RTGPLGRGEVALADRAITDDQERLALVNVMTQLDHLMAHPCVARRVGDGTLQLHGMYFHVAEAQAYILDGATSVFAAVGPDADLPGRTGAFDGPATTGSTEEEGLATKV